jgi:hypothetical protein
MLAAKPFLLLTLSHLFLCITPSMAKESSESVTPFPRNDAFEGDIQVSRAP